MITSVNLEESIILKNISFVAIFPTTKLVSQCPRLEAMVKMYSLGMCTALNHKNIVIYRDILMQTFIARNEL